MSDLPEYKTFYVQLEVLIPRLDDDDQPWDEYGVADAVTRAIESHIGDTKVIANAKEIKHDE